MATHYSMSDSPIIGCEVIINNTPLKTGFIKEGVGDFGKIVEYSESDNCYGIEMYYGNILYFTIEHFNLVRLPDDRNS